MNNKVSRIVASLFVSGFLLGLPAIIYAHGTEELLEKISGNYLISVSYNDSILQAGEPVRFDFNILNKDKTSASDFTDAWVRISPKDSMSTVLASDLYRPEFGLTGMTYAFPEEGEYELSVRFQKNGEKIADEVSFPLNVESVSDGSWLDIFSLNFFLGWLFGILIYIASIFIRDKKLWK